MILTAKLLKVRLLKLSLFISLLLFGLSMYGQNAGANAALHREVEQSTEEIFDSLIEIRRDFHTYPEISEQEKRTSEKIEAYLVSLGLEVITNIGGYGVVGILNGNKSGNRIAWRADIDALSSDIPEIVDFGSQNEGVRHICGHDVHATIGLGIANVLARQKEELDGTVYFVFQPSEENYMGAKAMIADGLFEMISPQEIYGLHVAPIPEGFIATKPEGLFADYKILKASYQKSGNNESVIKYTKELVSSFQNVEADSRFWDNRNLLDPEIGLGNPNTIFTDYITVNQDFEIQETNDGISISTFVGSSNKEQLDSLILLLKQRIGNSAFSEKLTDVSYSFERAVVFNDQELTAPAMDIISDIYGSERVIPLYGEMPDGRGDDFAYFQNHVPGVYFLLGASNYEEGVVSMPHAPDFAVDEKCIKTGVKFFSSMIIERLNK